MMNHQNKVDTFHLKQKYLSPELLKMIWQSNIDGLCTPNSKNQVLTSGTIKWPYNEDDGNVCVINNYSINGHLIPNSFVHIPSEPMENDTFVICCTCQIYNFIQNVEIDQESEISPDTSCIHCRFFNDHSLNAYELINQGHAKIP